MTRFVSKVIGLIGDAIGLSLFVTAVVCFAASHWFVTERGKGFIRRVILDIVDRTMPEILTAMERNK
jgi:hypothetical protein